MGAKTATELVIELMRKEASEDSHIPKVPAAPFMIGSTAINGAIGAGIGHLIGGTAGINAVSKKHPKMSRAEVKQRLKYDPAFKADAKNSEYAKYKRYGALGGAVAGSGYGALQGLKAAKTVHRFNDATAEAAEAFSRYAEVQSAGTLSKEALDREHIERILRYQKTSPADWDRRYKEVEKEYSGATKPGELSNMTAVIVSKKKVDEGAQTPLYAEGEHARGQSDLNVRALKKGDQGAVTLRGVGVPVTVLHKTPSIQSIDGARGTPRVYAQVADAPFAQKLKGETPEEYRMRMHRSMRKAQVVGTLKSMVAPGVVGALMGAGAGSGAESLAGLGIGAGVGAGLGALAGVAANSKAAIRAEALKSLKPHEQEQLNEMRRNFVIDTALDHPDIAKAKVQGDNAQQAKVLRKS